MNHTHDTACDGCGEKIEFGNLGQATADTVLCSGCLERAAEKALAVFEDLKRQTEQFVRGKGLTFSEHTAEYQRPFDLGGEG